MTYNVSLITNMLVIISLLVVSQFRDVGIVCKAIFLKKGEGERRAGLRVIDT